MNSTASVLVLALVSRDHTIRVSSSLMGTSACQLQTYYLVAALKSIGPLGCGRFLFSFPPFLHKDSELH